MEHRSAQLKISGEGAPEVTKLQNGRYRLEFRCTGFSKTDWYYQKAEGKIFADFGSLMDAEMLIDGVGGSDAIPDSVYPDMRLRENALEYTPSGQLLVYFAYETLTSSFVQIKDDNVDYELNGLRRVTRPLIAKADTSYTKTVGTSTISHTDAGNGTVTLYLAAIAIDNDDAAKTITETWVEAGTLRVRRSDVGDGKFEVESTFLVTEGATVGPVIERDTQNFEGLNTIVVKTLQDKDGNSIANGGENLVAQHDVETEFRYPGEVSIGTDTGTVQTVAGETTLTAGTTYTTNFTDHFFDTKPPVTNPIIADRFVISQTSKDIVASDWTYDGASGRWMEKDNWAKGEISGVSAQLNRTYSGITQLRPGGRTVPFANYTAVAPLSASGSEGWSVAGTTFTLFSVEGDNKYGAWSVSVSGGPGRPDGNKYVLSVNVTEDFSDVDGTKYYKKEIIVATIPTRT